MLINNHRAELFINGNLIDMNEDGLGIKLNNTLINPSKITASTTSYSYSFKVPLTPNNAKVLGNINALSKRNKFNVRYDAVVYADNIEIFNGSAKVTSVENGEANINIYVPKINQLEEIFGEAMMNSIPWYVPFDGVETINDVNEDMTTKYFFPMVAYGLIQKTPFSVGLSGYETYTSKTLIDKYANFHFNSFIPSMNLVELMKRAFERYGYSLEGDVTSDSVLNEIYLSQHIGNEDDPLYNYGNPKVGELDLDLEFANFLNGAQPSADVLIEGEEFSIDEEINYRDYCPYANTNGYVGSGSSAKYIEFKKYFGVPRQSYNVYNMFEYGKIKNVTNNGNLLLGKQYIASSNKITTNGIQIPCDGYYQFDIEVKDFGLPTWFDSTYIENNYSKTIGKTTMPMITDPSSATNDVEFQLLRFNAETASDEISHNPRFFGAYPNEAPLFSDGESKYYYYTQFPNREVNLGGIQSYNYSIAVDQANNPNYICGFAANELGYNIGYLKNGSSWSNEHRTKNVSLYNLTEKSMYYKINTDINGSRLSYEYSDVNRNELKGLPNTSMFGDNNLESEGDYEGYMIYHKRYKGKISVVVKLNRNDVVLPYAMVRRHYELPTSALTLITKDDIELDDNGNLTISDTYSIDANIPLQGNLHIHMKCVAPITTDKNSLFYDMDSLFDKELNLGNFLSSEQKISEWVGDIQKAFNLDFQKIGNVVKMNKNKRVTSLNYAIDIDDRVNNDEVTNSAIDFPSKLKIGFNVDTEEEGFYRSVPNDVVEQDDWKDYGEYGSEEIVLTTANDASDATLTIPFSYNWYQDFDLVEYWSLHRQCTRAATYDKDCEMSFSMPIIGKTEWWIEGYDYAENEKYDGRSFRQRFWFRGEPLWEDKKLSDLHSYGDDTTVEVPFIVCVNSKWGCFAYFDRQEDEDYWRNRFEYRKDGQYWDGDKMVYTYPRANFYQITSTYNSKVIDGKLINLDYYNNDSSLLDYFFNTKLDSSNDCVSLECYITPSEYNDILRGRLIKFNSDLYRVMKISSFNVDGNKKTKLELMSI